VTVGDETLGRTVGVGDEEGLGAAITSAIAAPDRAAVGHRLRDHVRQAYDWSAIAEATEATYRDVVRARRTRSPARRARSSRFTRGR
jgi:glycosyltransferase involved in cell wall biosynthesis